MSHRSNGGRTRLLVLDDDKAFLTSFMVLLRSIGAAYDAEFFESPQEALQAIRENPARYHAVITDIRMPGMDGMDFARSARQAAPDLALVFMTAFVSEGFSRKVAEFKKALYLEKPFDLAKVLKDQIPELLKT